ncbi:WXG100-like domain-containing protein [Streptomyces diastatochromogenes]|uniref:WXG100-like domain-containing protein n=1 Tax=Streptomyces diastatochromogenes TaxID=42236 RepID=UPI0036AA42B2
MGYTLPGWLDEVLDFIGINFPNVDEDDYREMADAMRDFADKFEGHGADAHKTVEAILASSRGWAVHSMQSHWSQVKAGHLDKIPELARLFADACDVVADIIFGMKTKAEAELAIMAGSVGLSVGLAVFTGGLSAVIGAAETAAMRQLVKRIIDEAADRIVDELLARVTEPVNAKLEAMIEDAVLNLAEDAFSLPPAPGGSGGGGGHGHGHGGMQLASAGGGSGMELASASGGSGAGGDLHIDHEEFESGAGKLSFHGSELHLNSSAPLGRAKGAFGRTKGKDPFTQAFDSVLHGGLKGCEKALGKLGKHVGETVPNRAKAVSRLHKGNDNEVGQRAKRIKTWKDGEDAETRTYLLNADGSVQRLHADGGTATLDDHDRNRLHEIVGDDGKFYIPETPKAKAEFHAESKHPGRAKSVKIDASTSDLARATQAARVARSDGGGTNYAAGRYVDAVGRESILVGYSNKRGHSERMIGFPILHSGNKDRLEEIFTEREPCKKNPVCARWLDYHFGSDLKVTHAADYYDATGKTTNKQHTQYLNGLKKTLGL